MQEAGELIQRVEEKIQQLLKQYGHAKKEVQRLQKENEKLRNELKARALQTDDLHQKLDTLKLSTAGMDEVSKKDFEKRINKYIREIDNCLALLNS